MSTEVWYRKWRPQRFREVAGQDHITRTLANAVASGRVAHAYLFCGPRGTGKTSTARILAKAVNCQQNEDGEPCNRCANCRAVLEGRALDLVEMDAASNRGIDEIRSLRDKVGYSPTSSAYKVYLIDEVHELTQHAFDALLKTLEEPPPHVIFALATTEADRVPATVASRCQRYDFRRIRLRDVVARLDEICAGEGITLPEGAAALIAERATGSLRDAVNLLEQVIAACGPHPALEDVRRTLGGSGDGYAGTVVRHALRGELAPALEVIGTAREEGIEPRQLQRATLGHLRNLLLLKAGAGSTLELSDEALNQLRSDVEACETSAILRLLRLVASADFRGDALSPLPLELALAEAILLPPAGTPSGPWPADERPLPVRPGPPAIPQPPTPLHRPSEARPAARPEGRSTRGDGDVPPARPPFDPADLTLETAQDLMCQVFDYLKARGSRTSAFINSECNITAVGEESLTIAYKHDFLAARVKSEESGNRLREIEDAIEAVGGRRYRLQITVDPEVKRWRRPPATGQTSHLLDEAEKLGLRRI